MHKIYVMYIQTKYINIYISEHVALSSYRYIYTCI